MELWKIDMISGYNSYVLLFAKYLVDPGSEALIECSERSTMTTTEDSIVLFTGFFANV